MTLQLELDSVLKSILCGMRITPLFWVAPFDFLNSVPARIRVLLILFLAFSIGQVLPNTPIQADAQWIDLVFVLMREFFIGCTFAFGILCAFAALYMAGSMLDLQVGTSAAVSLHLSQEQHAIMSTLLWMSGLAVFFSMDAHHDVLRALFSSFQVVPLGAQWHALDTSKLIAEVGTTFIYGFLLALPLVVLLWLLDVAIGIMSRTMPQMNVYFLFLPLKAFIGIIGVMVLLQHWSPMLRSLFNLALQNWGV